MVCLSENGETAGGRYRSRMDLHFAQRDLDTYPKDGIFSKAVFFRQGSTSNLPNSIVANEIIATEKEALRRWCDGDPSGFLEISATGVVYFDPFIELRLDGLEALTAYYDGLRGKIRADRFEMLNPLVQRAGDVAILTFNFVSYSMEENESRWNCTEVYRKNGFRWEIIQTHWSFTRPGK